MHISTGELSSLPTGRPRATPSPAAVAAKKLAASVLVAVHRSTSQRIRDLDVQVDGDRLYLTGRCGTYYTKQLAQTAAMRLATQLQIVNRIEVD